MKPSLQAMRVKRRGRWGKTRMVYPDELVFDSMALRLFDIQEWDRIVYEVRT